jgi:hypothetical protein
MGFAVISVFRTRAGRRRNPGAPPLMAPPGSDGPQKKRFRDIKESKMSGNTGVGVNQSGKSGGEAFGEAGAGSGALAGSGFGVGQAAAGGFGVGAGASGLGLGGSAGAGAGAVGAAGGDVSDNTSIGSININS